MHGHVDKVRQKASDWDQQLILQHAPMGTLPSVVNCACLLHEFYCVLKLHISESQLARATGPSGTFAIHHSLLGDVAQSEGRPLHAVVCEGGHARDAHAAAACLLTDTAVPHVGLPTFVFAGRSPSSTNSSHFPKLGFRFGSSSEVTPRGHTLPPRR